MYLRDTRALVYIRSSPRWDGRTVALTGTSMGGQQSLVTAGLNPGKVADPQVTRTALYFDTVNFAPHITAPTLIAMGFIDITAPPVGLWR